MFIMDIATIGLFVCIIVVWFFVKKVRSHTERLDNISNHLLSTDAEMHQTIAIGLYHRFKKSEEDSTETPWDFEKFVANIMVDYLGGEATITQGSGDFGVDIEHRRDNGLYLGQVKCYNHPVGYEPIAIIHSQMVKQGAKGGFVVTTSTFTDNAIAYAEDLNIELIDGEKLVEYWAASKQVVSKSYLEIVEP
jgi:restriction system protein